MLPVRPGAHVQYVCFQPFCTSFKLKNEGEAGDEEEEGELNCGEKGGGGGDGCIQ